MTGFAHLADAGGRLAEVLSAASADLREACLVAIIPNGVPVAEAVADALDLPLLGAGLDREGDPRVVDIPDVGGRTVIVVDDGVETGTASTLIGAALRRAGATRLILAVPVCPREAEPALRAIYDEVVAVDRPLARRDLRWHYSTFDTIDEAEARRRLDAR
jgi:predicted phosphoribosyltransferase